MARPIASNGVLEVTAIADGNGGALMNVWHYRLSPAFAGTVDGDAVVQKLRDQVQSALINVMTMYREMSNEGVNWRKMRYQWIWPLRYTPTESTLGAGAGLIADQALPMNVAGVVTLRTLFAGREGQGRKHFGGLSITDTNAGLTTAQFLAGATTVTVAMTAPINLGTIQPGLSLLPVVYHRANPEISHEIIDFTVQDTARVMRRRTLGVGI